jgi:hypothetical protein
VHCKGVVIFIRNSAFNLPEYVGENMKKNAMIFVLAIFSIVNLFLVTACGVKEDAAIAKENVELLIGKIIGKDNEAVKTLFANNKVKNIEGFDESIDSLMAYYEGDYVSYINQGLMTGADKDNGVSHKYYQMSCDITTTIRVYRMALKWYVKDTADAGNAGIWSLYIIKMEDDTEPEFAYVGDGEWKNGIHIAIAR